MVVILLLYDFFFLPKTSLWWTADEIHLVAGKEGLEREFFPKVFVIFSKKTEKEEELLREAYRISVRAKEADSAGCKLPTQK